MRYSSAEDVACRTKRHPYDAVNTYIHPANNGRICRACARERSRVAYQKRKTA